MNWIVPLGITLLSTLQANSNAQNKTASEIKKSSCNQLSLSEKNLDKSASIALRDFYWALGEFEQAFSSDNRNQFVKLIHPSIHKSISEKNEIYDSAKYEFGLAKQTVNRVALFEVIPGEEGTAECSIGKIRGVVGPEKQFVAFHDAQQKGQQIRFMTIYAPVAKSVAERKQLKHDLGLVMLQTQWWSYEQKVPDILLEEGKKLSNLNEPLGAWIVGESARRLLAANRYFIPSSLPFAETFTKNLEPQVAAQAEQLKNQLAEQKQDWSFIGFAPIYQKDGIEIGLKFRTREVEMPTNQMLETCKMLSKLTAKKLSPYLRKRFHGVECLPYGPTESTETSPKGGSQFLTWQALGI